MEANPKANNTYVESLGSSLNHGGAALSTVPKLVIKVVETEAWREFQPRMGPVRRHARFEDFVTAAPLDGIGSTVQQLRDVCRHDPIALDALDRVLQNPVGQPRRPLWGEARGSVSNSNSSTPRPGGTTAAAALRRLRKDRPDLHAEVLAERLSAHAAMVAAGFRPKTVSVRVDSPDAIARTLRRNLAPDVLSELRRLLADSEPST